MNQKIHDLESICTVNFNQIYTIKKNTKFMLTEFLPGFNKYLLDFYVRDNKTCSCKCTENILHFIANSHQKRIEYRTINTQRMRN